MVAFITSNVYAAESDEILEEYPYWIWYPDEQTLTISKSTFEKTKANESNGIIFRAPGADADIETTTFYYYYITPINPDVTVVLRYYENLGVWQAEMPWELETDDGWIECPIGYQHQYSTSTLAVPIYTNGHTIATGSGTGITNSWSINGSLPSDMPDVTIGMGDINATINDALNATTSATTQAGNIQSTVNTKLDQYEQGQITSNQMQSVIDTANTQLDDLASQSGNTLSDQIAINNAQNAVQIAQDKVLSQDLIDKINSLFNLTPTLATPSQFSELLNNYIILYNQGEITKEQAITTGFVYGNTELPGLQTIYASLDGAFAEAKTQADLQLINSLTQIMSQTMDNINSAGDVDKEKADAFESSESEELELLDDLVSVMQSEETENPMQEQSNINTGNTVKTNLEPVLKNKYIEGLLALCSTFIIMCIIVGTGYKFG